MAENAAIPALTDEQVKEKTGHPRGAARLVDPELGINVVDLRLIYGVCSTARTRPPWT